MGTLHTLVLALALTGGNDTVLLDFYSDSCGPCRQMTPVVQQLAGRGHPVRTVNVSREPELANRFGVNAIPCFVMLVDGREVDRVVGLTSQSRLETMLAQARTSTPAKSSVPIQLASSDAARGSSVIIPAIRTGPARPSAAAAANPAGTDVSRSGWEAANPNGATQPTLEQLQAKLLAATVRLKVEDPTGFSCGTGTIIDSRQGQALILTCGHLFRDSKGNAKIEVDLFGPTPAEKLPGKLLHYRAPMSGEDPSPDLALLIIRTPGPVTVARVAPPGYQVAKGSRAFSIGCSHGSAPTVQASHVTSLDKFAGAANIEASGVPVQGRSGGGLFSGDGYLIGVCNAANPSDNEGLYAALKAIYPEMDRLQLSFAYQPGSEKSAEVVASASVPKMPKQMPPPGDAVQLTDVSSRTPNAKGGGSISSLGPAGTATLTEEDRSALRELQRRKDDGAEVICIVRPRSNPSAKSEVIVLDKVSPAFLNGLTANRMAGDSHGTATNEGVADSRRPPIDGVVPASASSTIEAKTSSGGDSWSPRWLRQGYQGS